MDRAPDDWSALDPDAPALALHEILERLNAARVTGAIGAWESSAERLLHAHHQANHRLAVYGSLAPGRRNHELIKPLGGKWRRGKIRGRYYSSGWGAGRAYSGVYLHAAGDEVEVHLLSSASLASQWGRLDAFEGDEYVRLLARVSWESGGYTVANVYAVRFDPDATE